MARRGEVIGERYRLDEKIGEGAMGAVWRAQHLALESPVAIKIIHSETARNPQALARFEREALLAARIQSDHVVLVSDHGHHGELPYIVMEYMDGESLRERLDSLGRLSVQDTARMMRHVARALEAAHAIGLVHRDIKPENIFVVRPDDDDRYKVLDFGVAKVTDELSRSGVDPTRTGALLGTPFYLSPEQARGLKSLDHRADLWSLGVVAFECLTGRRPFEAPAVGPLIAKILHGPTPVPSEVRPEVVLPPAIDEWMRMALGHQPADRFGSAREMADAFSMAAGVAESLPTDRASEAVRGVGGTERLSVSMLGTSSQPATVYLGSEDSAPSLDPLRTLPLEGASVSSDTLALPEAPELAADVNTGASLTPALETATASVVASESSTDPWTVIAAVAVIAAIIAVWLWLQ